MNFISLQNIKVITNIMNQHASNLHHIITFLAILFPDACEKTEIYEVLKAVMFILLCTSGGKKAVWSVPTYLLFLDSDAYDYQLLRIAWQDLTGTTYDKSTVEISQNFVAFSECINFTNAQVRVQFEFYFQKQRILIYCRLRT